MFCMSLFEVIKVDGSDAWGVYVVNANDPSDKILVSTSLSADRQYADTLAVDLNRLAAIKKIEPLQQATSTLPNGDIEERFSRVNRDITFED
jgi:hypothetical protein